jgi:hypothetical protein
MTSNELKERVEATRQSAAQMRMVMLETIVGSQLEREATAPVVQGSSEYLLMVVVLQLQEELGAAYKLLNAVLDAASENEKKAATP